MKQSLYVISAADGRVKVGISNDPARRMHSLQSTYPARLVLAHVENVEDISPLVVERAAHELLREVHSHGEWFTTDSARAVAAIREAIDAIRNAEVVPLPVSYSHAKRRAAIKMLLDGVATKAEVARLVGTSRQLIAHWIKGSDVEKIREDRIAALWQEALAAKSED